MAHWDNAAVTREGIVLLNEMMAGHELILTRACGGTGTVEVSDMVEQTGLQEEKQTLKLTDEKDGPDGKTVTVQISSLGNEAEYLLQQIGVYAKLGTDGAEKLLFIMQDEGVLIPAESDKSFLLEIFCALRIGENGKLTVIVDPTGIVTLDRLSQTESKFDRLLGEIESLSGTGEPDSTTPGQVGQKYEDTTSGDIYTCTAITPGESGASPHYLWVPGRLGTLAEIRTAYSNISGRVSNPNLLPNWYYRAPVNQKGKSLYTENGPTIDCVVKTAGSVSFESTGNGLKITGGTSGYFHHYTDIDFLKSAGLPVTFSLLESDGSYYTATGILPSSTTWLLFYITTKGGIRFEIVIGDGFGGYQANAPSGTSAMVDAVKLEFGPVSTLAHKEGDTWVLNDPPPDYGLELLKCQRYRLVLMGSQFNQFVGIGYCNVVGELLAFLPTPVTLRSIPSIVMGMIRFVGVTGGMQVFNIYPSMIRTVGHESNGITVTFDVPGINPGIGWLDASSIILDANL